MTATFTISGCFMAEWSLILTPGLSRNRLNSSRQVLSLSDHGLWDQISSRRTGGIWPWCLVEPVHDFGHITACLSQFPLLYVRLLILCCPPWRQWERNHIMHVCELWKTLVVIWRRWALTTWVRAWAKLATQAAPLRKKKWKAQRLMGMPYRMEAGTNLFMRMPQTLFNFLEESSPFSPAILHSNWL